MFITVRQAPMFDSKQLHVKLSKYEELDAEVRFRIAPKLGHSSDITRLAFDEAAVVELHAAKGAEIKCSKLCLSSLK